ncbi:MAG: SOS response-associated peptidase, partial [Methanobacteriota archaeon]
WEYEREWIPHPVVRLSTTLPVAVPRPEGRTIVRARWGFPIGDGRPVGNARDDKLRESRTWSAMLGKTHCLVATTGVYEMIQKRGEKKSYWFRRTDRKPIVMPGLAGVRGVKGEERLCCAIVTTGPNRFFGAFHDRQVCSLSPKEADAWLAATDPESATKLLHAAPDDEWEAVPVDGRIFRPGRIEMEDLIEIGPPLRWGDAVPQSPKSLKRGLDRWG